MAEKQVKLWVVQENKKESNKKNSKIYLDLGAVADLNLIQKLETFLASELKDQNLKVVRENVSKNKLIKVIFNDIGKSEGKPKTLDNYLGTAIMTLASSFTEDKEEALEKGNSIYVAYLMIKDDIALDKIMKYANMSMPELEMIKYYLIEKNNF